MLKKNKSNISLVPVRSAVKERLGEKKEQNSHSSVHPMSTIRVLLMYYMRSTSTGDDVHVITAKPWCRFLYKPYRPKMILSTELIALWFVIIIPFLDLICFSKHPPLIALLFILLSQNGTDVS